jgi:hypothetical protein
VPLPGRTIGAENLGVCCPVSINKLSLHAFRQINVGWCGLRMARNSPTPRVVFVIGFVIVSFKFSHCRQNSPLILPI